MTGRVSYSVSFKYTVGETVSPPVVEQGLKVLAMW